MTVCGRRLAVTVTLLVVMIRGDGVIAQDLKHHSRAEHNGEAEPSHSAPDTAAAKPKNVLFIVIDDLRPQLGCYGQHYMHTPSIDKLASQSLVFDRAYCQFAFCAPSRNSFMTGRRPDRVKAWNFRDHFREPGIGENWTSLPQYFKKNGYLTLGVGKLFHPGLPPNYDPPSWNEEVFPYVNPPTSRYCPGNDSRCGLDPKTTNFSDIETLSAGLERLEYAAKQAATQPFFLGVGFHKPHLPWKVPPEFLDMYPLDSITPPSDGYFPHGAPELAWNDCWRVSQDQLCPVLNLKHCILCVRACVHAGVGV